MVAADVTPPRRPSIRDLTRERRPIYAPANGTDAEVVDRVLLDPPDTERLIDNARAALPEQPAQERIPDDDTQLLIARRDRALSRIALVLIDAAKMLDPILRIVIARVLALMALVAATGLAAYTLTMTSSWERVATCGLFLVLAAWVIGRGKL